MGTLRLAQPQRILSEKIRVSGSERQYASLQDSELLPSVHLRGYYTGGLVLHQPLWSKQFRKTGLYLAFRLILPKCHLTGPSARNIEALSRECHDA
jgi:hypothetical protein